MRTRNAAVLVAADLLGIGVVLCAVIALPVAPTDLDRHQFPKELVLHLAVLIAALVAGRDSLRGLRPAPVMAMMALVLWSAASAVQATNPWLALRATGLTATGATAFLLAHHLARRGAAPRLRGWITVAVIAAIGSALAQAWGVEHPFFAELRAPGGTLGNRNFVAHLAAIALPLGAAHFVGARRRATTLAFAALILLAVMALILTRSRAGWLAAAAAGTVMICLLASLDRAQRDQLPRRRLLLLPALLAGGVALAVIPPNTLEWRSDSPYRDTLGNLANYREGSGRGRLLQYQHSLELAWQHPIWGVGPGNWPIHYGDVAPANDPSWARNDVIPLNPWPSSDWIALVSERGWPAPLFAVALALLIAGPLWRRRRESVDAALRAAVVLGTSAAVAVAGLFDAVLLLALPLAVAAVIIGSASTAPTDERLPRPIPMLRSLLLVLVAVALIRSIQQTAAYIVAGRGTSRAAIQRAVRIDPFSYPLQIALGRRGPCRSSREAARAALRLAPTWPAAQRASRRCR